MKTGELLKTLDEQDRQHGLWLFTPSMLSALFPDESADSLKMSLRRHTRSGVLRQVAHGLYANERALSMPREAALEALIPYLRPRELNYISQESRLGALGVISQMTDTHLTVMTTGASKRVKTAYGVLEFTHTKRDPGATIKQLTHQPTTNTWVANARTAYEDLKAARRNLDMVDQDELNDLIAEESHP